MNDPGLDSPIQDGAREVETEKQEYAAEENEEGSFLDPSRWWFFSTAFPLIAGTFGPMASAFNLCALVESWRVYIPPDGTEEHGQTIKDPQWLIAVNAVSFVFAIIANIALLLNMARRVRFAVAQPITIIGWYISSILLIALVSAAWDDLRLQPTSQHAFTQPYYYAIMSAVLYFFISSLMVATVYGAWRGYYGKEFKLTMSQRTLMLQTISYLIYLLAGAAVYAHIEKWTFLDAVYWAECTLLTVGVGDYTPITHLGRGLLFPYAIGGIVILGLTIGSIRALILERGKEKMAARMVEKHRVRLVRSMNDNDDELNNEKQRKTKTKFQNLRTRLFPHLFLAKQTSAQELKGLSERERREKEFQLMRTVQSRAMHARRWTSLFISSFAWFTLWTLGAVIFFKCERNQAWSYFESLYFSYTSLLTIGFGDFYPQSNSGKPFFVFWSMLAIPTMTILISNMGDTIIKIIRDVTLWIGDVTLLPSDKRSLRNITRTFTKQNTGDLEEPPGLLGSMKRRASDAKVHFPRRRSSSSSSPVRLRRSRSSSDRGIAGQGREQDSFDDDDDDAIRRRVQTQVPGPDKEQESNQDKNKDNSQDENRKEKNQDEKETDQKPKPHSDHHHYILIKEIRKIMRHLDESPPKKYTFEEWSHYLQLIGEDESSPADHRPPRLHQHPHPQSHSQHQPRFHPDQSQLHPQFRHHPDFSHHEPHENGKPSGNSNEKNNGDNVDEEPDLQQGQTTDTHGRVKQWSWLDERSPLMGTKPEAQWLLDRMTSLLEDSIRMHYRKETPASAEVK